MLIIFSVVPSPYQRDFFLALAESLPGQIQVFYLEKSAPDSPWPEMPLRAFESVLPGVCLGKSRVRSHVNWRLPPLAKSDKFLVNLPLTSVTTQWLTRRLGRKFQWYYWGEVLRPPSSCWKKQAQDFLFHSLKNCRGIFAVGKQAAEDYRLRLHPADIPVWNLPYSCNLESFRQADCVRITEKETTFLFCGQMILRKGIDVLLHAFTALVQDGIAARLLLSGREAELLHHLEKMPQDARTKIEFVGFTAPERLPALFARADVFVLPSRHDGWGVVINQALGAGLPIISTIATGAALDLIVNGQNGILIPHDNIPALASAMKKLALDARLRRKMGEASGQTSIELEPSIQAGRLLEAIGA